MDEALGGTVEVSAAGQEALAGLGKGLARIVAEDGGGQLGDARLTEAESVVKRRVEALGQVVDALGGAMKEGGDTGFCAVGRGGPRETLASLQELEAGGAVKPVRLLGEVLGDLVLGLGDELGGGRRRGGT